MDYALREADLFTGDSVEDLRLQISVLSKVLSGYPAGKPTAPDDLARSSYRQSKATLLGHISTILTTGAGSDEAAAGGHAVTGNIEPDRIVVVIATPDEGADTASTPIQRAGEIHEVPPRGQEAAVDLLKNSISYKVNFQQHLRDVATLLSYLLRLPREERYTKWGAHLFAFVLRRSFRKLASRLDNGDKIWGRSPISILQEYFEQHSDMEETVITFKRARDGGSAEAAILSPLLEKHGISCTDTTSSFTVSSSNISGWLAALAEVLNDIRRNLFSPKRMANDKETVCDTAPSPEAIHEIMQSLILLHALLRSSLFEILAELPVKYTLRVAFEVQQKKVRTKWAGDSGISIDIQPEPVEDPDTVSSDVDSLAPLSGENDVLHVKHYLQTITTWFSATQALLNLQTHNQPVTIYQFKCPPGLKVDAEHFKQFKTNYLHSAESAAFLQHVFTNTLSLTHSVPVHAEAALMALAYAHIAQQVADKEAMFTNPQEILIGISKKCCWCCAQYAHHPMTSKSTSQASGPSLQFLLPGSHSLIYPWCPPPFGVPAEVLKPIHDSLFSIFHEVAHKHDTGLKSTQSSPSLTTSDLDLGMIKALMDKALLL